MSFPDLSTLFRPGSIVIVGASDKPGTIGNHVVENLLEHSDFTGTTYLVNPRRDTIHGHTCLPDVAALPGPVDVAVIVIPAAQVIDALETCASKGVSFALVLTSGFGEAGVEGRAQQDRITEIAERSGMRIVGPNCPGLCNIVDRIGMTFSPAFKNDKRVGPIGLATQGGGLGRNMLQAGERGAGVALWASLGNTADLDVPDAVNYFSHDDRVSVIVTLLEGIKDGPALIASVLAATEADKPVVMLKVGRSAYGARAVQSHTASMAGSTEVNRAVLAQLGVIEVDDTDELMDVAWLLTRATPGPTTRIGIWGSSGGAVSLCADLIGQAGLTLSTFSDETTRRLREVLPSFAATGNPVDVTASSISAPELVDLSLTLVADDPNVDLVVIPIALDYGPNSERSARSIATVQQQVGTPILPVWMSDSHGPGYQVLAEAGFCSPLSVSKAVKAVRRWADYGAWRAADRGSAPPSPLAVAPVEPQEALPPVTTEPEAKAWLAEHAVAVPEGVLVHDEDGVRAAVAALGTPLVAKIVSPDITHKSDVGGVVIGIRDVDAAVAARRGILDAVAAKAPHAALHGVLIERMHDAEGLEIIVGVHRDPVFGHLLTVGAGGVLVELLDDVARHLLPLDRRTACELVDSLRLRPLFDGLRGGPRYDLEALVDLLLAVSDAVSSCADAVEEIDLNPVVVRPIGAGGPGAVALDAAVVATSVGRA